MAGFDEFKRHEGHFLTKIDIQAEDSGLTPSLIQELLQPVSEARSVGEMHASILESVHRLNRLKAFRTCSVKILPGEAEDQATVAYQFQWLRKWAVGMKLRGNSEGGSVIPAVFIRNLRGVADRTTSLFEFKPNTHTWGFALDHFNPTFIPGKWGLGVNCYFLREQRDLNLTIRHTGAYAILVDSEDAHTIKVGRDVRTNYPRIDYSSIDTIRDGVLTSEKYSFAYKATSDRRNDEYTPTGGHLASVTNELAAGQGLRQHTLTAEGSWFLALYRSLTLEIAGKWKWLVPWDFTEGHFNDRLRMNYCKGFRSAGERKEPADTTLATHFDAPGDNLGTTNLASVEAKLHFHKTPLLHHLGISPFLYANLIGVGLDPSDPRSNLPRLRGSCGLGLDWHTKIGRLEVSYAAKVIKRSGDIAADLQVLFFEN